ncbi:hypothetical protein UY416_06320 [Paenibacillus polymyxa]|uniref:hypothetical protein n=1 Tax=Paenibacillus polymyxa TaxID=1406 RepID=UPI002AB3BD71|nr:hypothetical protein [Paenibacillus polymyxa]MDY8045905.1 hypothetical protein [Paenibacillus polymyxa]
MQTHGIIPGRERSLLVLNFFYKILTFVMGEGEIELNRLKNTKTLPVYNDGKVSVYQLKVLFEFSNVSQ